MMGIQQPSHQVMELAQLLHQTGFHHLGVGEKQMLLVNLYSYFCLVNPSHVWALWFWQ